MAESPLAQFRALRDVTPVTQATKGIFDPKYVQALLHKSGDVIVEAMFRRAMTAPVGGDQKSEEARSKQAEAINSDIVTIDPKRGNSLAYTLDRLQRERPELFAQVEAGLPPLSPRNHRARRSRHDKYINYHHYHKHRHQAQCSPRSEAC